LRDIFLHIVDAEDRLINYVIPGRTEDWSSQSPDEFHDMKSISERVRQVESKSGAYVAKCTQSELERMIEMSRRGASSISVRVEDVLVHVALENIHHFGELIALLWQIDVEPPHMGWVGYLQR
jgi:uncharacterized damage-inducible protein DinB